MYKIDVAIPNYNYGRYLRECVESVYAQNIDNMRVLVIDNGSTDDSISIIEELKKKFGDLHVIINDENMGMHASFNKAIDWAQAEYFTLVHADDALADGALARAISFLDDNTNVVLCHGRAVEIGRDDHIEKSNYCWSMQPGRDFILERCQTAQNTVSPIGVIIRTWAQKQVGYYDTRVKLTTDIEMWLRLATLGDVGYTTSTQGRQRIHAVNDSAFTRERLAIELNELMKAFLIFFEKFEVGKIDTSIYRNVLNGAVAQRAYWAAFGHLARGSFRGSVELLHMVLTARPYYLLIPPIGYLFKRADSFERIRSAFRHLVH